MNDVLHRLLRTKKILAGLVFVFVGIAFITAGQAIPTVRELGWLNALPWSELGGILFGAGLFSLWLDAYFERERGEADEQRLRRLLVEQAPAMKEAVIKGFAFENEDLRRVATPELLDNIIGNSLSMRLGDEEFARELYADIRDQAVQSVERWYDAKISVRLSMPSGSVEGTPQPSSPGGRVITVRQEYTTVPAGQVRRFTSVSDIEDYRELTQDPASTFVWYYNPTSGIDASSKDAFELVQFTVDGEERPIRRSSRKGAQTYSVNLATSEEDPHCPRTIAFTYRLQPAPHSRWIQLYVDQPTRGVDIELDYSDTDIAYVNMIDFITSSQKSISSKTPDTVPDRRVGLRFDGWVMPHGGVAFVWIPNGDIGRQSHRKEL
ncbi:hypothetical protein [Nocardia aurea]|uniref:Uncharacterized protein n=1 Tax=Nocardia aurea TaxID=2144174 RepID=A0ABV3FYG6_9NOCA